MIASSLDLRLRQRKEEGDDENENEDEVEAEDEVGRVRAEARFGVTTPLLEYRKLKEREFKDTRGGKGAPPARHSRSIRPARSTGCV